jgi:hypothetical protein
VQFDKETRIQWGFYGAQPWQWYAVCDLTDNQCPNAFAFSLTKGKHTLRISTRESGAMLDALELTDLTPSAYRPNWNNAVAATPAPTEEYSPTPTRTATSLPVSSPTLTPTHTRTLAPSNSPTPTWTPSSNLSGVHIRLETEQGDLQSGMILAQDSQASRGQYIEASGTGFVEIQVNIPKTGNYYLWGRAKGDSYASDSFKVQFDSSYTVQWGFYNAQPWQWYTICDLADNQCPNSYVFRLTKGQHILRISTREGGARLDALELTDQLPPSYRPTWTEPAS